ncbi:MAG: DNA-protecting protein DprA [Clostridia bacterium]|nr:DNA-protecting protein DprA [Clostridia bacterium]
MYSQTALKIYAAKREGVIKSNAGFWRDFGGGKIIDSLCLPLAKYAKEVEERGISLICVSDERFPITPENLKLSEKPYFFAYKGDISLLYDKKRNIAVVGTLTPDGNIIEREKEFIKRAVDSGYNIVSGLAVGCDTVSHAQCLAQGDKTIAFLPSTIEKIYPASNIGLASEIVGGGGFVITEYVNEPTSREQNIGRFIARDRLQAMFADKIILVASHLPGQGDSGSRHAMAKAAEYGAVRYVMYNEATDSGNPLFGLNRQLLENNALILTQNVF